MNFKNLIYLLGVSLTVIVLFFSCNKNDGLPAELRGKWNFKQVNGIDVTANKMYINIEEKNEYSIYDGCNAGGGAYSANKGNSIEFSSPVLTLVYCDIYKTVASGDAITKVRKYMIKGAILILYDDKNEVILTAGRE